jgi:mono/diheme cytochrome c family protein
MKRLGAALIAVLLALGSTASLVWWFGVRDAVAPDGPFDAVPSPDLQRARGAYLARAGNCMACHTRRGDPPFAGGRPLETPFGTVFSSNLTPDVRSGLGGWSARDFWRALHHGRSRDGRLLVPAFPYTSYTEVTRADSDALFAYLQSLPPVATERRPHALRWPYRSQWALAVWRALYFRAGVFVAQPDRSTAWNRGAYLVRGLGHCNACHAPRNVLGASGGGGQDLSGGQIPMQGWYAPSLTRTAEAGVAAGDVSDVRALLQTGVSPRGSALGPMAEVVLHSTQHLTPDDLQAMATYLQGLAHDAPARPDTQPDRMAQVTVAGTRLYERHCADCHGENGEGIPRAYPPLAGNRAVRMDNVANLVQIVLRGGFAPATAGNPRPFGMPPFQMLLTDTEVAAVINHIRGAWGNRSGEVTELDVARQRAAEQR